MAWTTGSHCPCKPLVAPLDIFPSILASSIKLNLKKKTSNSKFSLVQALTGSGGAVNSATVPSSQPEASPHCYIGKRYWQLTIPNLVLKYRSGLKIDGSVASATLWLQRPLFTQRRQLLLLIPLYLLVFLRKRRCCCSYGTLSSASCREAYETAQGWMLCCFVSSKRVLQPFSQPGFTFLSSAQPWKGS